MESCSWQSASFLAWPAIPGLTPLALTWIVNGVVALVVVIDEYVWPADDEDQVNDNTASAPLTLD